VDQVLAALQTRGDTLHDLSADVALTVTDQTTATSDSESGTILLQQSGGGDGRVRIHFMQRTEGNKIFDEDHEFTLADGWLVDRDFKKKHEDRKQVVRPGDKVNLFQLGDGPFPLPIGQKPQVVRNGFDVSLVAAQKDDPPDSVHLLLKPKPQTDLASKFAQIDVWTDRQMGMPVRIVTVDSDGQRSRTADLTNIKLDAHLTDADFSLPNEPGWDQVVEPFRP